MEVMRERWGMPKVKWILSLCLFGAVLVAGCMPDNDLSYEDTDVVSAFYDKEADLSKYETFSLPDTIRYIKDEKNPDNNIVFEDDFDEALLATLKDEMIEAGYEYVEKVDELTEEQKVKNLHIPMSIYATKTRYTYVSYPWYPGGWSPWLPGGYWGGVRYPYIVNVSYKTGTVYMDMLDLTREKNKDGKIKAICTGVVDGLIPSSSQTDSYQKRVEEGVEKFVKLFVELKKEQKK
ncbi:hypothetical protein FUAX_23310 [Fulvitalea axinellae]|uniref:DUF4136 domain-containing protein n=1 Tax=Fulvitalea axinellae TaxID=1182444 RepID=A0AAU9CCQ3_9BACT|nr:hypothetical protein FUAX_23310 [Fulvitalea axinellae]